MKTPIFTGSNVAIVTPFKNGAINFDKLGQLIEFQIKNGTNSITICGTTGESSTLTHEEHCQAIEYCVKKVAGRVPVIAGTGSNDTAYALELSLFAENAGADGLLMVAPYYNKTTQKGLVNQFIYIADRVKTPIVLYNVPSRTQLGFTAESYHQLSKHPNINGVKEASGDFTLICNTVQLCGDQLNMWSGNDDQIVPLMSLGAKGVISVAANIIPGIINQICTTFAAGDLAASAALQTKYFGVINALFKEVNPIPIKSIMNHLGFDVGELRMPLCPMDDANLDILKNQLAAVNLDRIKLDV